MFGLLKKEPEVVPIDRRIQNMQHIPLQHAYLCVDCQEVGNNSRHCPACAGGSVINLASALNCEPEEEESCLSYSRESIRSISVAA